MLVWFRFDNIGTALFTGAIQYDPATGIYTVLPAPPAPGYYWIGFTTADVETRAYPRYTLSFPAGSVVTAVDLEWQVRNTRFTAPTPTWGIGFRIGSWMGLAIDQTDWGGGTLLTSHIYAASPIGIWRITPASQATAIAAVNNALTLGLPLDMEWRDTSTRMPGQQREQAFSFQATGYPHLWVEVDMPVHPSHLTAWTP